MKHLFQFSLLLLALLFPATALAYDFEVDGIYYNINGNEATVTYQRYVNYSYQSDYSGSVTIPATVTYGGTTYSVTSIGNSAFRGCSGLTSITIPNSVTSIGEDAFLRCTSLTSIDIPNSVSTIGRIAFADCSSLTSISVASGNSTYDSRNNCNAIIETASNKLIACCMNTVIPNTVTTIGEWAFSGCSGLTSVTIPNSVSIIGNYVFNKCTDLASVTIGNSVTTIGDGAFWFCSSLTSIVIPNSVTSIGVGAFSDCGRLTSINLPNSITSIASSMFSRCGLRNITIPNSVTSIDDFAFYQSSLTSITIPNSVTSIGNSAFSRCSRLTSITIPNSVTDIGDEVFLGCSGLISIDIPNSVTSIGNSAFSGCSSLTSIDIPNSVTSIGNSAFYNCTDLASVTIGNSVIEIGDGAFYGCSLIEIYSLAFTPPIIDFDTFSNYNVAILYVPKEAMNAYKEADYWKNFTIIVGIDYVPPVITFVVDGIYYMVTNANVVSVIANEDVEAFYTGDVIIPAFVTFEEDTFTVTGIESNAFDGCFELTSVVIPNTVESIGEQAFQGCTGLTSVTIGSGVKTIGSKAFNYCNALTTVKCVGTVPPVMASADCFSTAAYNRATLIVPRNYEATYAAANYWYKFAHIDGWGTAGMGDVDGDGDVNIKDVTVLIDALLGIVGDSFYYESADLNHNGRIDIGDVTSIVDNLLNGD